MSELSVPQAFAAALDGLIRQVEKDSSVLAAILCGSLAHDTVWARSDIDLVFVTIDDRKVTAGDIPLYADGVNVHAILVPRTDFRKMVEGSLHGSFVNSFLSKGRLLYTRDPTIETLFGRLKSRGQRDTAILLLEVACGAVPALYKARKWLLTRGDIAYTAYWILYSTNSIARMEVIQAGLLPDREVIPHAETLNPPLMQTIYRDLLRKGTDRPTVEKALTTAEEYLAARAAKVFAPLLEYLREQGDVRSSRDLEDHFSKTYGLRGITTACEYLADIGLIDKASTAVLLTKRSHITLQELAFFASEPLDAE
jgi:predicted nucleotidyltransferase